MTIKYFKKVGSKTKKVFGLFFLLGITFSLVFGTQAFATSNVGENVETASQSTKIVVTEYFVGNVVPPTSIFYNDGKWSGRLYRSAYQFDGVRTIANYSGTVYCSGACPAPSSSGIK